MTEILWHGRGGQGAFTAARLLGAAFALRGNESYALAFPSFGPERRGAPIRAFTKLDEKPIGDRSEIERADFSIFLDDTLFSEKSFEELKPNGKILLNTKRIVQNERVISIDADELAIEILKLPITNTIMLGAFTAVCDAVSLANVEKAIYQNMSEKLQRRNILAVRAAVEAIRREKDR